MEIRNLITFAQVAEQNSFTKAARVLNYAQSTVSFQIRQLEEELDCILFERIGHTITLTERGQALLEYAKQIRYLTDEFNQSVLVPHELNATLRIAAPDSVAEDMMRTNYADFHRKYPGISLKFVTGDTDDMIEMLNRNEADLMLTLDAPVYHRDFIIVRDEVVEMLFVTGAGSSCAREESLTPEELMTLPLFLTEHGMGYRRVLDNELAKRSLEARPTLEMGRTDIIVTALTQTDGVAWLPDYVVCPHIAAGRLRPLSVPAIRLDIRKQLAYHRNKWITQSMAALIEYIKENEFGQ